MDTDKDKLSWQSILWHVLTLVISLTALVISLVAFFKIPTVRLHPETIEQLNSKIQTLLDSKTQPL